MKPKKPPQPQAKSFGHTPDLSLPQPKTVAPVKPASVNKPIFAPPREAAEERAVDTTSAATTTSGNIPAFSPDNMQEHMRQTESIISGAAQGDSLESEQKVEHIVDQPAYQAAVAEQAAELKRTGRKKHVAVNSHANKLIFGISGGILLILLLATAGYQRFVNNANQAAQNEVITYSDQDVSFEGDLASSAGVIELNSSEKTLLANGQLVSTDAISLYNNGFYGSLETSGFTADQRFVLPDESGTICLDSNNCGFSDLEQSDLNELDLRVVDNTTDISALTLRVNTNRDDIALNVTDIANNTSSITQNAASISANSSAIAALPDGTDDINQGGNSFGVAVRIGSNDNFALQFETNGIVRATIDNSGDATFNNNFTVQGSSAFGSNATPNYINGTSRFFCFLGWCEASDEAIQVASIIEEVFTDLNTNAERINVGRETNITLQPNADSSSSRNYGAHTYLSIDASNTHDISIIEGENAIVHLQGTGDVNIATGQTSVVQNNLSAGSNLNLGSGTYNFFINSGGATTTEAVGGYFGAIQESSGDISELYGLRVESRLTGLGNVTSNRGLSIATPIDTGVGNYVDNYALYIEDQSAVSSTGDNFNIYSEGSGHNLLQGHTAIGGDAIVDDVSVLNPIFGGTFTGEILLNVTEEITSSLTGSLYIGTNNLVTVDHSANSAASILGSTNVASIVAGNANNVGILIGNASLAQQAGDGDVVGAIGLAAAYENTGSGDASAVTALQAYTDLDGTGTIGQASGGVFGVRQSSTGVLGVARGVQVDSASNTGGGTLTTNYGINIDDQTAGTDDYGIAIQGADTYALWVGAGADNSDAANGITFGNSGDTNIYRGAADQLRTDDSIFAAGNANIFQSSSNSTTAFAVQTSGGSDVLNVDTANVRVAIGRNNPGATLDVDDATSTSNVDIFRIITDVGGVNNVKFRIDSDGDIFTDGSTTIGTPADVAERYENHDGAMPGDVVAFSDARTVERTSSGYQKGLAGVVSTEPGLILSGDTKGVDVALAGRVPVKISSENGVVRKGDYLTSSINHPGYAMKAVGPGPIVGTAMEDASGAGFDVVDLFVHLGYHNPLMGQNTTQQSITNIHTTSSDTFYGLDVQGIARIGGLEVEGDVDINGRLTVDGFARLTTLGVDRIVARGANATVARGEVLASSDSISIDGKDVAGTVTVSLSDSSAVKAGEAVRVSFSRNYSNTPHVSVTPTSAAAGSIDYYVKKGVDGFTIEFLSTPVAGATYSFDYQVIE